MRGYLTAGFDAAVQAQRYNRHLRRRPGLNPSHQGIRHSVRDRKPPDYELKRESLRPPIRAVLKTCPQGLERTPDHGVLGAASDHW